MLGRQKGFEGGLNGGGGRWGVSFRAWGNVDNTSYPRDLPRPQSQVRYCSEL